MLIKIPNNIKHTIVIDISGVYAQIHNQGYFEENQIDEIQRQYSDTKRWRVLVLDGET